MSPVHAPNRLLLDDAGVCGAAQRLTDTILHGAGSVTSQQLRQALVQFTEAINVYCGQFLGYPRYARGTELKFRQELLDVAEKALSKSLYLDEVFERAVESVDSDTDSDSDSDHERSLGEQQPFAAGNGHAPRAPLLSPGGEHEANVGDAGCGETDLTQFRRPSSVSGYQAAESLLQVQETVQSPAAELSPSREATFSAVGMTQGADQSRYRESALASSPDATHRSPTARSMSDRAGSAFPTSTSHSTSGPSSRPAAKRRRTESRSVSRTRSSSSAEESTLLEAQPLEQLDRMSPSPGPYRSASPPSLNRFSVDVDNGSAAEQDGQVAMKSGHSAGLASVSSKTHRGAMEAQNVLFAKHIISGAALWRDLRDRGVVTGTGTDSEAATAFVASLGHVLSYLDDNNKGNRSRTSDMWPLNFHQKRGLHNIAVAAAEQLGPELVLEARAVADNYSAQA